MDKENNVFLNDTKYMKTLTLIHGKLKNVSAE